MTQKAQILILIVLIAVLFIVFHNVRRRKLDLKYALSWFVCDVILIVIVCIPRLIVALAKLLGIQSPVNMIFFLGFLFSLMLIFVLTVSLSRVSAKVRRLAQIQAIEMWDISIQEREKLEKK